MNEDKISATCHICQKSFSFPPGGVRQRRGYYVTVCSQECDAEIKRHIEDEKKGIYRDYWYPDGALTEAQLAWLEARTAAKAGSKP